MDTERIADITINFDKEKINPQQNANVVEEKQLEEKKSTTATPEPKLPIAKLPRCQLKSCNKKIGYTGYSCHCGLTFCAIHRFPKEHACSHDYKKNRKSDISQEKWYLWIGFS